MESRADQVKRLAMQLMETGRCGLPLTWEDLARRVSAHEDFTSMVVCVIKSSPSVSQGFIFNRAIELVEDFLPVEEPADA